MFMHVEGLSAFDLCLLEQHSTDGTMQMHISLSVFLVFLSLSLIPVGFRCTVTQREVACPVALDFLAPMETLCLSLRRGGQEEREMETDRRREKKGVGAGRRREFGTHAPLRATCLYRNPHPFVLFPWVQSRSYSQPESSSISCHRTHKWGLGLGCMAYIHSYLMYISLLVIYIFAVKWFKMF